MKDKTQVRVVITPSQIQISKKNKKKPISIVPLSLCWIQETTVTGKKDIDPKECFELIEPSKRWRFLTKSENEKINLLNKFEEAIKSHLNVSTLPDGLYYYFKKTYKKLKYGMENMTMVKMLESTKVNGLWANHMVMEN